ncbi:unnamed protein product, partial [Heterosigma akashiwo]
LLLLSSSSSGAGWCSRKQPFFFLLKLTIGYIPLAELRSPILEALVAK